MTGSNPPDKPKFASKALLELVVLTALSKDSHRVTELLEIVSGIGIVMPAGTLYPFLGELKRKGSVRRNLEELDFGSAWMYNLTDSGTKRLAFLQKEWSTFHQNLMQLAEKESVFLRE